jgi:CheY-like chemotaxis protein
MHSMQILVVDDDPLVLRNTIALLEDAGHQVAGATGASEALQALQHSKFDLLITDHLMPMMTGAQLIEEIRRRKISLPVLIMTGYRELATDTVTNVSRLMKPFTQQQLLDAIRLAI